MRAEYSQKFLALCLGIVALLSATFAATTEQAAASKVEAVTSFVKLQAVEPAPVVQVATVAVEVPTISTAAGIDAARWSQNVTLTLGSRHFRFESDGLPDHELPSLFLAQQRGYGPPAGSNLSSLDTIAPLVESPIDLTITLNPVVANEATESPSGLIGVLVNGTQVYNDHDLFGREEIASLEYGFVDVCNGHPNALDGLGEGVGGYHYHAVPSCTTDSIDIEGQHSSIVGVLIDGFPVYGSNDIGGEAIRPIDLDACNGHFGPTPEFPDGIYHYHFLDQISVEPFPCLTGVVDEETTIVVGPQAPRTRFGE